MTFKTISDNPTSFTFTYEMGDLETAQVASTSLFGYMIGTYQQPAMETTIRERGILTVEYVADDDLTDVFKRICESLTSSSESTTEDTITEEYTIRRVAQLKESGNLGRLLKKIEELDSQLAQEASHEMDGLLKTVASYELELLDYADRLLSDEPLPMDSMTAQGTLELLGLETVETLKAIDTEKQFQGLDYYESSEQ